VAPQLTLSLSCTPCSETAHRLRVHRRPDLILAPALHLQQHQRPSSARSRLSRWSAPVSRAPLTQHDHGGPALPWRRQVSLSGATGAELLACALSPRRWAWRCQKGRLHARSPPVAQRPLARAWLPLRACGCNVRGACTVAHAHSPRRRSGPCAAHVRVKRLSAVQAATANGKSRVMHSANFPMDADNRTYHLGTKVGTAGLHSTARIHSRCCPPLSSSLPAEGRSGQLHPGGGVCGPRAHVQ